MTFKLPSERVRGRLRRQGSLTAAFVLLPLLGLSTSVVNAGGGSVTIGALQIFPGSAYLTSIACMDADTCYLLRQDGIIPIALGGG